MKRVRRPSGALCLALAALTGCAGLPRGGGSNHWVWRAQKAADPELPIYLLGEVRRPGVYPAEPAGDFVDLVTRAHGFGETADLERIEVLRRSGGTWHVRRVAWGRLKDAPTPLSGDVVMVHSTRQSKFERRIQLWAVIASLLASLSALVLAVERR